MRIIISGGGDIGKNIGESLVNAGHEVVLIEEDKDLCGEIASELDALVLCGDATRPDMLEKAGIDKSDVVIAMSGNDHMNVITALVAKEYGVERVIIRLNDIRFNVVCQKLGITEIVNPKIATARHVADMVRRIHPLDISTIVGGNIRVFTAKIQNEKHINKKIEEIGLKGNALIVIIQRGEEFFIPKGGFKLLEGDSIIILCEEKDLKALAEEFGD